MEKLLKAKKIKLSALIASAALGVLSLLGVVIFALKLLYAPLIICITVAVGAIYAVPLLWISLRDAKLYASIIEAIERGAASVDEISVDIGITPDAITKMINKCVRLGYITNTLA